jgi:hypothetical protein
MRLDFRQAVSCVSSRHKITGRIYGTDVRLASDEYLIRQDIRFRIRQSLMPSGTLSLGPAFMEMEMLSDQIPTDQIGELISFLFDRDILFLSVRTGNPV